MKTGRKVVVTLKLDPGTWERYSAEASALRQGLSTYLRERLEKQDELREELASIRRALENLSPPEAAPGGSSMPGAPASITPGLILELMLLLRSLAQQQRTDLVQAEVRRLGLEVWQPSAAPTTTRSR